jgi:cell division initiation protein
MREEVSSLRDRLQQFEDLEGSIRAALVHAEQASNDLRRAAIQEAEGTKQSAQREADFTIREAQSRSHQMLADSSARIERVQDSYDALQEAKRSFANDFRHLLKTYTDMMEMRSRCTRMRKTRSQGSRSSSPGKQTREARK